MINLDTKLQEFSEKVLLFGKICVILPRKTRITPQGFPLMGIFPTAGMFLTEGTKMNFFFVVL